MDAVGHRWSLRASICLLCLIAGWAFAWPLYRAFLNIEIDRNEGWNGYFADAAMGGMPLYPAADCLITNNYPPLSFYIIGGLGRITGDPILTGRLLSLLAVVILTAMTAIVVRQLGGSCLASITAAAFFLGTISRFFTRYVGMNDPQLLAHLVMLVGFAWFLQAKRRARGYLGPVLIMVVAGFIKHNVLAVPATVLLWLALSNRREAVKCCSAGLVAVSIALTACYLAFGRNFFANLLCPREYSLRRVLNAAEQLQWIAVGLTAAIYLSWKQWSHDNVRLVTLYIGIAFLLYFVQKGGAGVDCNSQFDLLIAVAIGVGLTFARIPSLPLTRWAHPVLVQTALALLLCVRLLVSNRLEPLRMVFDPSFHNEIALREAAMARSVVRVRGTPGDVICDNLVSYRAGKPFVVDVFNTDQRILAGALPADAVSARIANGNLTFIKAERLADWDNPVKKR